MDTVWRVRCGVRRNEAAKVGRERLRGSLGAICIGVKSGTEVLFIVFMIPKIVLWKVGNIQKRCSGDTHIPTT